PVATPLAPRPAAPVPSMSTAGPTARQPGCVMLPPDVGRQLRRLQLRARRAVANLLGGEYHSVFKGTGLAFADVRAYQPGDDVRAIDWNVTARMGQPFLK